MLLCLLFVFWSKITTLIHTPSSCTPRRPLRIRGSETSPGASLTSWYSVLERGCSLAICGTSSATTPNWLIIFLEIVFSLRLLHGPIALTQA